MKRVEILKLGRELLKLMSKNDLKVDDIHYVGMFYEYEFLRSENVKYASVIKMLSDKFLISESKVKRIIRRLEKEVFS